MKLSCFRNRASFPAPGDAKTARLDTQGDVDDAEHENAVCPTRGYSPRRDLYAAMRPGPD